LNQWIAVAVAEKIGSVEAAADFLSRRSAAASPADMLPFLDRAANLPPEPEDEMPS
jgi:hypothetical protein